MPLCNVIACMWSYMVYRTMFEERTLETDAPQSTACADLRLFVAAVDHVQ